MACYVINHDNIEARKQGVCVPKLEDYYECLHHRKEVCQPLHWASASCLRTLLTSSQQARAQAIQDAYRKMEAAHPRENAPTAGQIRSLGLLGREKETQAVLDAR